MVVTHTKSLGLTVRYRTCVLHDRVASELLRTWVGISPADKELLLQNIAKNQDHLKAILSDVQKLSISEQTEFGKLIADCV